MTIEYNIEQIIEAQRQYFNTGVTLPIAFRLEMLQKLYDSVVRHEAEIAEALRQDLGKSEYESFMCEIGLSLTEITYMLQHTKKFAKEHRVRTPLAQFPARSYTKPSPYGNVLIMSPWNYPFLLNIEPLTDAIAAGNTAIIKPSAYAPATGEIVAKIISECFPPEYITVVTGGRKENELLLKQKFDMIFFTGSQGVGKEVLRNAAEHLTPAVLELGGKSPCIVDDTAKIALAAKRIVFGKYLNCGQTCVAPDYILCHKNVKDQLLQEIKQQITAQFGNDPLENADYGRIVNEKHFDRLLGLIEPSKLAVGGTSIRERLQIAPTVLDNVTWEDAVMQEEIFGPILPIITYDNFDDIYTMLSGKQKPLAFYLFSQDKSHIQEATARLPYGGGCINDVIIHLATSEMAFGGVGESGMGNYHGKAGFDAFSHTKSMVDKKTWLDLPMRYQPYDKQRNGKLLRMFLK